MAFVWDKEIAARIWHFGKWLIGSSIFGFLAKSSERIIFAAVVDVSIYGIYAISRLWVDASQTVFAFVMSKTTMAALSELLREGNKDVSPQFGRIQWVIDGITLIFFLVFLFGAEPFIRLIYPPSFEGAADYAVLLAPMFLRLRFTSFGSLLVAAGETRVFMRVSILQAVAAWLLVWTSYSYFGFEAAIFAFSVSGYVGAPLLIMATRPLLATRNSLVDWLCLLGSSLLSFALFIYLTTSS